jgi:hypothetical protein
VYHYAGNNPVRYTDPDGRFIESILQIIGSALLGAGSSLLQQMWDRVDLSKEESLIGKITSAAVQMFDQASDIVSHIFPGSFDYDAISIAVFAAGGIVTGGLALWSKSSLEFMMAGGLLTGMLVETFDRLLHDRNLSIDEMLKQGFIYAAMPPAMDGAKKFGKIL